jgi:prevent-host-death family protein
MVHITATDLKTNLGKYLSLALKEEIHITKNGKDIAVLSAPKKSDWTENIIGIAPDSDLKTKDFKSERLLRKYESLD